MVKFPSDHFHSTDAYYSTPLCPAPSDIKAPVAFTECIHSPYSAELATGSCAGGGNSTVAYQDARAASPLSRGRPQGAAARSTEVQVQGSNPTPYTAVFHSRPTTVSSGIPRIRDTLDAGTASRRGPPLLHPREAIEEIGSPLSVRQLDSVTAVGNGDTDRDSRPDDVNCLKCFNCAFAKEVKENRVELLKGPPLTASSAIEVDSQIESPKLGRGAAAAGGSRARHQDRSQSHREAVSHGVQRRTSPVICHKVVTAELLSQNLRVPSIQEVSSTDESTTDPAGRKVPSDLGATKRPSSAAGQRLLAGIRRNRASAYASGPEHYAHPVLGRAVDALLLRRRTSNTARNSDINRSYTVDGSMSSPADINAFGGHVSDQNVIKQEGPDAGSKGTARNSSEAGSSAPVVPPESTSPEWGELDTYSTALQQQGVLLQPAHSAPVMSEVVGRTTVTPGGMDYNLSSAWSSTLPSNAASILKSAANVILRAPALRADTASPAAAYPSPSTQMPSAALYSYVPLLPIRLPVPPLFRVTHSNFLGSQQSTSSRASADGETHAVVNRNTDSKGQHYIASFYPGAADDEARLTEIASTNTNLSRDAVRATLPSRQEQLASALPLQHQGALKQAANTRQGSIASSTDFSSPAAAEADLQDDSNYGLAATANRAAVPEVLHSTAQALFGTTTCPEKQTAQEAVQMQKRGINSPSSQAPVEPLSHTGSCSTSRILVPDSEAVAVATETRQSPEGAHAAPARTGVAPTIAERFNMKGKETEITIAKLTETAATGRGNLEASQNLKEIRTAVPPPGSGSQTQARADSASTNSAVTQGGAPSSIYPSQEETHSVSTGVASTGKAEDLMSLSSSQHSKSTTGSLASREHYGFQALLQQAVHSSVVPVLQVMSSLLPPLQKPHQPSKETSASVHSIILPNKVLQFERLNATANVSSSQSNTVESPVVASAFDSNRLAETPAKTPLQTSNSLQGATAQEMTGTITNNKVDVDEEAHEDQRRPPQEMQPLQEHNTNPQVQRQALPTQEKRREGQPSPCTTLPEAQKQVSEQSEQERSEAYRGEPSTVNQKLQGETEDQRRQQEMSEQGNQEPEFQQQNQELAGESEEHQMAQKTSHQTAESEREQLELRRHQQRLHPHRSEPLLQRAVPEKAQNDGPKSVADKQQRQQSSQRQAFEKEQQQEPPEHSGSEERQGEEKQPRSGLKLTEQRGHQHGGMRGGHPEQLYLQEEVPQPVEGEQRHGPVMEDVQLSQKQPNEQSSYNESEQLKQTDNRTALQISPGESCSHEVAGSQTSAEEKRCSTKSRLQARERQRQQRERTFPADLVTFAPVGKGHEQQQGSQRYQLHEQSQPIQRSQEDMNGAVRPLSVNHAPAADHSEPSQQTDNSDAPHTMTNDVPSQVGSHHNVAAGGSCASCVAPHQTLAGALPPPAAQLSPARESPEGAGLIGGASTTASLSAALSSSPEAAVFALADPLARTDAPSTSASPLDSETPAAQPSATESGGTVGDAAASLPGTAQDPTAASHAGSLHSQDASKSQASHFRDTSSLVPVLAAASTPSKQGGDTTASAPCAECEQATNSSENSDLLTRASHLRSDECSQSISVLSYNIPLVRVLRSICKNNVAACKKDFAAGVATLLNYGRQREAERAAAIAAAVLGIAAAGDTSAATRAAAALAAATQAAAVAATRPQVAVVNAAPNGRNTEVTYTIENDGNLEAARLLQQLWTEVNGCTANPSFPICKETQAGQLTASMGVVAQVVKVHCQ